MAVDTIMSILQIRKRRLGGFKPLGQSPKAEKWGFRPRLVSVQHLTVKNSGSQMKTWKYEGRPRPDIPHRHPDWPSALGNVRAVQVQGGLLGWEDALKLTGQLGFAVPSHTAGS